MGMQSKSVKFEMLATANAELLESQNKANADIQSKSEEIERLQSEIDALSEQNRKSETELTQANAASIVKLEQMQEKVSKYKIAVNKLKDAIAKHKQQLIDEQEKNEKLKQENENSTKFSEELKELTANRNDLQARLNASESARNELDDAKQELMDSMREMNQSMEELQMTNAAQTNQLFNKEKENQSLRENVCAKQAEIESLNAIQAQSEEQKSEKYKIQIDNLQNEVIDLKKQNAKIVLSASECQSIDISMEVTPMQSPNKSSDSKLEKKLVKASKNMKIIKEKYKIAVNKLKDAIAKHKQQLID